MLKRLLWLFSLIILTQGIFLPDRTIPPSGFGDVKLQILAAGQAGNFGVHTSSFRIGP
jgi:hypothetical protein